MQGEECVELVESLLSPKESPIYSLHIFKCIKVETCAHDLCNQYGDFILHVIVVVIPALRKAISRRIQDTRTSTRSFDGGSTHRKRVMRALSLHRSRRTLYTISNELRALDRGFCETRAYARDPFSQQRNFGTIYNRSLTSGLAQLHARDRARNNKKLRGAKAGQIQSFA